MGKILLIEQPTFLKVRLDESTDVTQRIVADGIFGCCGKPTANGRVYPREIMEREFRKLEAKMNRGSMLGELDHPKDGETRLQRVSHRIKSLAIQPNNEVIGSLELLSPRLPNASIARGLVESGVVIGVSSRGLGSVRKVDGYDVIQEDFTLLTYDIVADPAWQEALPGFRFENFTTECDGQPIVEGKTKPLFVVTSDISTGTLAESDRDQNGKDELNTTLLTLEGRIESLQQAVVAGTSKELEEVKAKLKDYEDRLGETMRKNDLLKKQLVGATDIVEQVKKIAVIESSIANVIDEHKESFRTAAELLMNESVESFVDGISSMCARYEGSGLCYLSHAEAHEKIKSMTALLSESADAMSAAQDDLKKISEEVMALKESNGEIVKRLEVCKEAITRKDRLLSMSVNEIKDKDRIIKTLNSRIDESNAQNGILRVEHTNLTEDNTKLNSAKSMVESRLRQVQQELETAEIAKRDADKKCEDLALEIYKHKKIIGSTSPSRMLESFSTAKTQSEVDLILEQVQSGIVESRQASMTEIERRQVSKLHQSSNEDSVDQGSVIGRVEAMNSLMPDKTLTENVRNGSTNQPRAVDLMFGK